MNIKLKSNRSTKPCVKIYMHFIANVFQYGRILYGVLYKSFCKILAFYVSKIILVCLSAGCKNSKNQILLQNITLKKLKLVNFETKL